MRVSDAMTREVRVCHPGQSICDAARLMAELDCGVLPVGEGDRLVGMITDRDIAVRAVAQHKSPDTLVRDAMSNEVKYCFEDQHVDQVARNMSDLRVRRLPVLDRDRRPVGVLSLGDVARCASGGQKWRDGDQAVTSSLAEISRPRQQPMPAPGPRPASRQT